MPTASAMIVTFGALATAIGVALLAVRTNALITGIIVGIEMLPNARANRCWAAAPRLQPYRRRAASRHARLRGAEG